MGTSLWGILLKVAKSYNGYDLFCFFLPMDYFQFVMIPKMNEALPINVKVLMLGKFLHFISV